ncbi:MAG: hypothetical protein ACTSVM_05825 [Candidatus Ranarchaeia archaeon]
MTNAEVVLQFLRQRSSLWCDDYISDKTGITPRQQVHQLGTRLAKNWVLVRHKICGQAQ